MKRYFLLMAAQLMAVALWSQQPVNTITEEGAWCWFADPRAITYTNSSGTINSTYIGYIDVHGNIKATQIDHVTNTSSEVLIRSWFQPDDHNNPTFLVLPDERVMIFYSRHTDEPCFYYRVSQKPGDITMLGREVRLGTANNTTYPSPFILADDPDHIYLCWRGIGWHPTIARLTMPDENDDVRFDWGPFQIVQSQKGGRGVRPYAKYVSNGKDKIYLAYTTTHPDNQSVNYIYLNYVDINSRELKDIKGRVLETVGSGVLHNVEAKPEYKKSYPNAVVDDTACRNWLWEVALDKNERPVIATVRINDSKDSHDYYHVRWTGNKWQKTFLSNAGGHFHQTPNIEKCYSGGMAIDKANSNIIYGSVPVEGEHGRVYELRKFTVKNGKLKSVEAITSNSPKNNVRPYVIANQGDTPQLVWMYGDYYDWIVSSARPQGYPTAIRTLMQMPPQRTVDNAKSITLTVSLTDEVYQKGVELLKTPHFIYGLIPGEHPKPYIKMGNKVYESSNVFGTSNAWQSNNRGTGGHWYNPVKPNARQVVITTDEGVIRTFIDGMADQYIKK